LHLVVTLKGEKMSERSDFGSFLVGFVVGGLTGAAVALLLAPQSGEETRTVIKEKAIELKDMASETYEDVAEKANVYASDAKVKVGELSKEAKKTAEELRTKGKAVYEDGKEKVEKLVKKDKGSSPEVTI
jgi:gas vesicle protein